MRKLRAARLCAVVAVSATILAACSSGATTSVPSQAGSVAASVAPSPLSTAAIEEQTNPYASVTGPITVGSLEFTSSRVMAELYVRVLREAGYDAQLTVPSTNEVFLTAMDSGRVDVLPAYASLFADFLYVDDKGEGAVRPATSGVDVTLDAANDLAAAHGIELLNATRWTESCTSGPVTHDSTWPPAVRSLVSPCRWRPGAPVPARSAPVRNPTSTAARVPRGNTV